MTDRISHVPTVHRSLVLPAPAMERIFDFLNSCDLALMAQTCAVWKRIVYRKSVWQKKNFNYHDPHMILHDRIPTHARHIGITTRFCYLHWLQEKTMLFSIHDSLPIYLQHITDPEKFMKATYKYWQRHGCPCYVKEHHELQDLLIVPFPASFSKAEKQRVLYRLIDSSFSTSMNAYAHYLACEGGRMDYTHTIPTMETVRNGLDPLQKFRAEAHKIICARLEAINVAIHTYAGRYHACMTALTRRGFSEFENNDTWYNRDRDAVWSTAGFLYKK